MIQTQLDTGKAVRNAAYALIEDLPEKRQRVYEELLKAPSGLTNKQISSRLGWPINCVTGRVKELRDANLVVAAGVVYVPDYQGKLRPNNLWKVMEL